MPSLIYKSTVTAACSALLAVAVGCQMPWVARGEAKELESAHHRTTEHESPQRTPLENVSAAADAATEAQVMRDVQQISAKDPAAGKLLLDELSRAEPKLWPLTVQQFRARQVFHDQLLSKPKRTPTEFTAADPLDAVASEPPSAEVGRLTDPRGIRPDPAIEQAFARATPANMPAPTDPATVQATLVAESALPASQQQRPAVNEQVVLASAASAGAVQQAIYSVDAMPPAEDSPKYDWQQHLRLAIDDLNARLVDGPRSTAEAHQLVSLRLLELLSGNTEAALKPIANISTEEQDYWSSQLFALATFLDHHRQPNDERRAAASVVHLDEAVGHLRELGTLSLRNLAFCKNVFGYGAYEPIDHPTFTPGQQVTLYLEVENYHSESTQKGYTTKLGASYELVNEEGERVAGGEFPNVEDSCQSRRRDFHIQYGLVLPKTAKAGKHHLKLAMNDRQSDKRGSASIALEIR